MMDMDKYMRLEDFMDKYMRLEDFMDELKRITDHTEFRKFVDENLMNTYELPDFRLPGKLKADVAGALYYAIHGTVE